MLTLVYAEAPFQVELSHAVSDLNVNAFSVLLTLRAHLRCQTDKSVGPEPHDNGETPLDTLAKSDKCFLQLSWTTEVGQAGRSPVARCRYHRRFGIPGAANGKHEKGCKQNAANGSARHHSTNAIEGRVGSKPGPPKNAMAENEAKPSQAWLFAGDLAESDGGQDGSSYECWYSDEKRRSNPPVSGGYSTEDRANGCGAYCDGVVGGIDTPE